MANTITKWKSGQNPVPGTESIGFPYCDFTWNVGSGTDHAEVISKPFAYPGRYFTLLVNTEGASISSSTTLVYTVYGTNNVDLAHAKWDSVVTGTLTNVNIDDVSAPVNIQSETYGTAVVGKGVYRHYKLGLDPNQDPGTDYSIRVGLNAPPVRSDA